MKGVPIKGKEPDTVLSAVYMNRILRLNDLGFGAPSKHIYVQ